MPCEVGDGTGWVCEEHPSRLSGFGGSKGGAPAGAAMAILCRWPPSTPPETAASAAAR